MRTTLEHLTTVRNRASSHPSLLLQRYLFHPADGTEQWTKEKRAVLQAAMNAAQHDDIHTLYRAAFERWSASLPTDAKRVYLQTTARLIVGLGSENVLETGIRLHHTFGMPIIPGSALKGLAAHYCDQVWGREDPKFKKPKQKEGEGNNYHRLLFGATDDSGCIVFHDAWYDPRSSAHPLALDVMTPHHPKWNDGFVPPTDFDSPKPVPFLSVTGRFRIVVSWNGPAHDQAASWTNLALSLLKQALADWGVGGKTSSGYGRLGEPSNSGTGAGASQPTPPAIQTPKRPQKRNSGTPVKVRIIDLREKGFKVQEEGRAQGTLTVGQKPGEIQGNVGDTVDVEIHNDDPRTPQYRWPSTKLPKKKIDRGSRKR